MKIELLKHFTNINKNINLNIKLGDISAGQ